jgi:hypothetical protein
MQMNVISLMSEFRGNKPFMTSLKRHVLNVFTTYILPPLNLKLQLGY